MTVRHQLAAVGILAVIVCMRAWCSKAQPTLHKRQFVRVIDGDTIVLGDTVHRLWGIDAPELGQICKDGWPAGEKARDFLRVLIMGQLPVCDDRGRDNYGRTLSVCLGGASIINRVMVGTGNAWAFTRYTPAFLPDEREARSNKAGMHAHDCQPAWAWRQQERPRRSSDK